MADATPSLDSDSQGVVDESLKQRLKKQPRRQLGESIPASALPPVDGEVEGVELRGQQLRGDQ